MFKSFSYKILFVSVVLTTVPNFVLAAPPVPQAMPSGIGGAINTHDMMMLKEKQKRMQEKEDFQNLQDRKKNKKESVIQDSTGAKEKIYNSETSEELKIKQEELQKTKKEKKSFFKNKSKNQLETQIDTENNENIIEKTDTTTTIKAIVAKEDAQPNTIYIESVGVTNSRILSDREIQQITDLVIGKYVTFDDLKKMVDIFNYTYATKGFVTARAFLPPQDIENGLVKINLVEGTIGDVTINENVWTRSSYIEKRISQESGELFDVTTLEQDVIKFNKYNEGVKLKANLVKGEEIGTTDIELIAEEKFPFHVVGLMDNAGRKTIGELRGGLMFFADSLFGQRDRLSLGAYASRYSKTPFVDYNIPVNKYDGRVGATFSSSFSEIGEGPYKMFNIESRSFNYSLYYSHPLVRKAYFELTSHSAANYKQATTSFDGFDLYTDKITSFETSLNARYDSKRGIWYLTQGIYQAFPIISDASKYFKYTGSLIRLHDFGRGIVGQFRGAYQVVPKDVIPFVDQFQAGGLASVRGYSEGLLIGKTGYILSGELLFPIAPQKITLKNKNEKKEVSFLGKYIKGVAFVDHAGVMPFKGVGPGARSIDSNDYLVSMGAGLRIALPGEATARLYWGLPLLNNNHEVYYRNPRFSFELSLAPDFDKLLKIRKRNVNI